MSVHAQLAEAVRAGVPETWRIVGYERDTDEADAETPVTVTLKLDTVRKVPEAPGSGRYLVAWTVTVATAHADPELADPAVYDALVTLCDHLDAVPWLRWTEGQKVLAGGRYAFDLAIETMTTPDDEGNL